jgi:hypothetical protein
VFDLNRQIDLWKRAFAARRTCSTDELEELESHLREEIEVMIAAGLSPEKAFAQGISRLGDPVAVCCEFAKNEKMLLGDSLAIRAGSVLVVLVGLAALVLGMVVWRQRQDGLLAAHVGSISFAYVVPFLLAVVGSYAIIRTAIVKSGRPQFRDRFSRQCKILLGVTALVSATGAVLGGFWAQRQWGRFWGWDPKEIGALAVVSCAVVLLLLVSRRQPTSVQLGQASLLLSLVTFVAWFGPVVYSETLGVPAVALLVLGMIAQLSILGMSLLAPRRCFAES